MDMEYNYIVIGYEIGEGGTRHIQGYVQMTARKTLVTMKRLMGDNAHLECARRNAEQNREYCTKDESYIEEGTMKGKGERTDIHEMKKDAEKENSTAMFEKYGERWLRLQKGIKRQIGDEHDERAAKKMNLEMDDVTLKVWQKRVLARLYLQDKRQILFVVDTVGNMGKSFLAKYLMSKWNAMYTNSTVYANVIYAYDHESLVIFDLTRDKLDFMNYGLLETFKNGMGFSAKYESKTRRFEPPMVIVFMNEMPNMTKLSVDRYDIFDISV